MITRNIISLNSIERSFNIGDECIKALNGVSFNVAEGEFVTIMGSSGSGKSTLLNLLGGMDRPSAGSYQLNGVDVSTLSNNALAALRNHSLGFVFQSYNLLARTTAIENVELPLIYNRSIHRKERTERAQEALIRVGLKERMSHTPGQMSGGQQQRVAIARALVNDPALILADEATGNLDTKTSYEIMALFQELNAQGKTIVFVTHEPDIALFSKRTIKLSDGKVISDEIIEESSSANKMLIQFNQISGDQL